MNWLSFGIGCIIGFAVTHTVIHIIKKRRRKKIK